LLGAFHWGDVNADDAGLPGPQFPWHDRSQSLRGGSQRDPKPPHLHKLWGALLGDDRYADAGHQDADQQGCGCVAGCVEKGWAAGNGPYLGAHKNTIAEWERRSGGMKSTLMLYGLCHTFIQLIFEEDEIDTVVSQRVDPAESTDWTVIILERASRFLVKQQCGRKDATLFKR